MNPHSRPEDLVLAKTGIHQVAIFYGALFLLAQAVAWLGDVQMLFSQEHLAAPDVLLRLLTGGCLGAALAGVTILGSRWIPSLRSMEHHLVELVGPLLPSDALLAGILSGISEEVLFRGALQPVLGFWPAAFLFALAHIPPQRELWPWTVFAALSGLGLGWLALETGEILTCIGLHVALNAVNLVRLGRLAARQEA